jgi:hypothetical protein
MGKAQEIRHFTYLSAFRPHPTVSNPVGGKSLEKIGDQWALDSELSVLPSSKPHTPRRLLPCIGSELFSFIILRRWSLL